MRVRPYRLPSRTIFSTRLLSLFAGFVCALALSNAALPPAFGQAPSAPAGVQKTPPTAVAPAAQTAAATTAKTAPGKGAHEGIKVNGYWKIDVRNPDGTLDKHVEFENSLAGDGGITLATLLQGGVSVIGTSIFITAGSQLIITSPGSSPVRALQLSEGPCGSSNPGTGSGCILTTSTDPVYNNCLYLASNALLNYSTAACLPTLSIASASGHLILSGSIIVGSSSYISYVATTVDYCPTSDLASCSLPKPLGSAPILGPTLNALTGFQVTPALSLSAGQSVNISVTLSFQ